MLSFSHRRRRLPRHPLLRPPRGRRQPQGNFTIEGDFEYSFELPDKFRHKENIGMSDINIDMLQVLNGQEVHTNTQMGGAAANIGGFDDGGNRGGGRGGRGGRNNDIVRFLTGGAATDDPEQNRKAIATQMARLAMVLLLNPRGEEVAWIGIAESPDGRADVLEFKTPDGVATHLVLDEKTRLPLMLTWVGTVQSFNNNNRGGGGGGNFRGGGPPNFPQSQAPNQAQQQGRRGGNNPQTPQQANLQMHVSDYKTVSGIKFPHLIQSGANNETTEELVVKNLRVNPSFRADLFTTPK